MSTKSISSRLGGTWHTFTSSGFVSYFGPATVVSVAYVDPGNFGTDIQGGAAYAYALLWVVWLASIMAMILQYLSGKLGIATGHSLPELIRERLRTKSRVVAYWLSCEVFAVATDLAEFLGVTLGLHLLFKIPLLPASFIAAFDVVIIFLLAGKRFRRIELLITTLVTVIGLGYVYEIFITRPDPLSVATSSIIPSIPSSDALFVAVGIIGATVMPHALSVHSWLTKSKLIRGDRDEKRKLLKYHRAENTLILTVAGLINGAILLMSAAAFYGNSTVVATVEQAYLTLAPLFGVAASIIFAITLLASGLASSTTGVLAGQSLFEGLLGTKLNPWIRRIVIRIINVVPTTVAITIGLNPLSILVYSQVVLSLLIPLPLVPLLLFTRNRHLMGEFANRRVTTLVALAFTMTILVFNGLLLLQLAEPNLVI